MANLLLRAQFDPDAPGWTLVGNAASVLTDCFGDYHLVLTSAANALASATIGFDAAGRNQFIVETGIFVSIIHNAAPWYVELLDATDGVVAQAKFQNDTITIDASNSLPSTVPCLSNIYRQLIFVVDKITNSIAFYVSRRNGTGANDDVWVKVGESKNYAGETITKLRFWIQTTGVFEVDDIAIYEPDYFITGDSIADGKWNSWATVGGMTAQSPVNSPAYKIEELMGVGNYVANRAFGGAWLWHIDQYIQSLVIDQYAKRVILHCGHNDLAVNTSLDEIKNRLNSITNKLITGGIAGSNITLCKVAPSSSLVGVVNQRRMDYNSWLVSKAASIGARLAFNSEALSIGASLNPAYDQDGIHINVTGNGVLAKSIVNSRVPGGVLRTADDKLTTASFINPYDILEYALQVMCQATLTGNLTTAIILGSSVVSSATVLAVLRDLEAVLQNSALTTADITTFVSLATTLNNLSTLTGGLIATAVQLSGGFRVESLAGASFGEPTMTDIYRLIQISTAAIQVDTDLILAIIFNKRYLEKVGTTWYLVVRDSNDVVDILRKALKGPDGVTDITDIQAAALCMEMKSSV